MSKSNIGKKITDGYCNGYFGRIYDLAGSRIEGEAEDWIVVRLKDDSVHIARFDNKSEKKSCIKSWTNKNNSEEE